MLFTVVRIKPAGAGHCSMAMDSTPNTADKSLPYGVHGQAGGGVGQAANTPLVWLRVGLGRLLEPRVVREGLTEELISELRSEW